MPTVLWAPWPVNSWSVSSHRWQHLSDTQAVQANHSSAFALFLDRFQIPISPQPELHLLPINTQGLCSYVSMDYAWKVAGNVILLDSDLRHLDARKRALQSTDLAPLACSCFPEAAMTNTGKILKSGEQILEALGRTGRRHLPADLRALGLLPEAGGPVPEWMQACTVHTCSCRTQNRFEDLVWKTECKRLINNHARWHFKKVTFWLIRLNIYMVKINL